MMKKLVKHVLDGAHLHQHNKRVKSVLADGVYGSNRSFTFPSDERIKPAIRARRNSVASTKNSKAKNGEV